MATWSIDGCGVAEGESRYPSGLEGDRALDGALKRTANFNEVKEALKGFSRLQRRATTVLLLGAGLSAQT